MVLDPETEYSAGVVLMDGTVALVIRVRRDGYELPKGHIESDESAREAASRELCEETGLLSEIRLGRELGQVEYCFGEPVVRKVVTYFRAEPAGPEPLRFGTRPPRTRELRWVTEAEAAALSLVNETLRAVLAEAFTGRPGIE